jgi:hypothetical protein
MQEGKMMRNRSLLIGIFVMFMTLMTSASSFAYNMLEYWSLDAGDTWVYDRDLIVFTAETHSFGQYLGNRLIFGKEYCGTPHLYIYKGEEGILAIGLYERNSNQFFDVSGNPLVFARANMSIGESVTTIWPAGFLDDSPLSFTITLEAAESVTVPAGTFSDVLRLKVVVEDDWEVYVEKIWLAKGIGVVKMYRVSETNNTPDCWWTCGAFDCNSTTIEQRTISLLSYTQAGNRPTRVVVIPMGN